MNPDPVDKYFKVFLICGSIALLAMAAFIIYMMVTGNVN